MRAIALILAFAVVVIVLLPFVPDSGPGVEPAASVSFTLHGSLSGWGLTASTIISPGPTLTVNLGDVVTMNLFSADGPTPHTWFVDYNENFASDTGEPDSGTFSSRTVPDVLTFTADRAGRFTYWCEIHFGRMVGTFEVRAPNRSPTLTPIVATPSVATPGQSVTFASTAADADNDPLSYTFAFDDGSFTSGTTPMGGGTITASHAYAAQGTYTVSLMVSDGKGGTDAESLQFTVTLPIVATIQAPWTQLYPGQTMDLTVLATVGGSPLAGASTMGMVSTGGTLNPSSGTTDSAGTWKTVIQTGFDTLGTTITVSVTVNQAPYIPGSASFAITVVQNELQMSLTSNRQEMMSFETATIRVRLESGGVGVAAGLITPSTRFGGTFGAVTELGGGSYAFGWTAPARTTQGFARIDVRAKVGGYTDATSFTTILVDPNKTNTDAQLFLLTSLPATSVNAGGTLQVTIFLFTIEGFVVSGGTVTARLFGPGSITVVVDELNGVYRLTYIAPASVAGPTNIRIDITANKATYGLATTRVGITVLPAA